MTVPVPLLTQSPYQHYVYSYPHKTSYRPLPVKSVHDVWSKEDQNSLFLYIHIPFCEMRCGFCNLFTTVTQDNDFINNYIKAVQRQAHRVQESLDNPTFARFALGGGTPTQLPTKALAQILEIAATTMGAPLQTIPVSVEVSPDTATPEKLDLLFDYGTDRISIGVQSFIDSEVLATQRRQTAEVVKDVLCRIREIEFPTLNIDLIYGLPGQTIDSWLQSIHTALQFQPEELYLYPLYVRPLTGLGMTNQAWDDHRLDCYRAGRDLLLDQGYEQVSMRMFRKIDVNSRSGPVYCCQVDGMIGLGCGARSYTQALHYSYDYAVNAKEIKHILARYIDSTDQDFDIVNYGFELNREEQQRRFILLSLLSQEGLDMGGYCDRFHTDALTDFPKLQHFLTLKLLQQHHHHLHPTELGLERSDAIGPSLFSANVNTLMHTYKIK
ncbi:STM4012 family radical SAM protein [Leptothoe sp. LEGE 181152]|nr:STM4012 family radical SAM protein [Leptothoe sp. LEGE 181152]